MPTDRAINGVQLFIIKHRNEIADEGRETNLTFHGLRQIPLDLEQGTYQEPSKMTVGEWLDIWTDEYLNSVKHRTVEAYKANCKRHIKPAIGTIKLTALTPIDVQRFYNRLKCADSGEPMSAKTKKNIHGTLHRVGACGQAEVSSCQSRRQARFSENRAQGDQAP